MTHRLVVLLAAAVVWLALPDPVHACKCLQRSPAAAVKRADAVFWGEVTAVAEHADRAEITVAVRGVWKGTVSATATVFSIDTSCTILNVGLKEGTRWIFAASLRDGDLHVRQCDGSRRATAAARAAFDKAAGPAAAP